MTGPGEPFAALRQGVDELGLALPDTGVRQLADYCVEIEHWNRAFNLISRKDIPRLVPRHVLDSLTAAPLVRGPRVLDVGSGAGLPGIPLAIALPDVEFVLCDRASRRVRFLRHATRTLGLANVQVAELDLRPESPLGEFATITARAVCATAALWRLCEPHLQSGGRVVQYASTRDAPAEEIIADERFRAQMIEVKVPGMAQPHEILTLERT